jgi:hypothetical protein
MIKDYLIKRKNYKILKDIINKNVNNFKYRLFIREPETDCECFYFEQYIFLYKIHFTNQSWNYRVIDRKTESEGSFWHNINLTYFQRKSLFKLIKNKYNKINL